MAGVEMTDFRRSTLSDSTKGIDSRKSALDGSTRHRNALTRLIYYLKHLVVIENRPQAILLFLCLFIATFALSYTLYNQVSFLLDARRKPSTALSITQMDEFPYFGFLVCIPNVDLYGQPCPSLDAEFVGTDGQTRVGAARRMIRLSGATRTLHAYGSVPKVNTSIVFPGPVGNLLRECYDASPYVSPDGSDYEMESSYSRARVVPEVLSFYFGWKNISRTLGRSSACVRPYLAAYTKKDLTNLEDTLRVNADTQVPFFAWNTVNQLQVQLTKTVDVSGKGNYRIKLNPIQLDPSNPMDVETGNPSRISIGYRGGDVIFQVYIFNPLGLNWQLQTFTEKVSYTIFGVLAVMFSFYGMVVATMKICWVVHPTTGRIFHSGSARLKYLRRMVKYDYPMLRQDWELPKGKNALPGALKERESFSTLMRENSAAEGKSRRTPSNILLSSTGKSRRGMLFVA